MITYPYGYEQTVSRSHQMALYATLGRPGTSFNPAIVRILSGQVTLDNTATYRGQISCRILVPPGYEEQLPTSGEALSLAPYGNELTVWRGVLLDASYNYTNGYFGRNFMAPLGVYRISEDTIEDSEGNGNIVTVTGYDRSRSIARNKFTTPWVVGAGTTYSDAITAIVLDRLPFLNPDYDMLVTPTTLTTPLLVFDADSDPWEKIKEMAASVGMAAYFDGLGRFVLELIEQQEESWSYTDGDDAILTGVARRISDEPGYNGVLISSESSTLAAPIKSELWDDDPDSPTYAQGPYGRVPKIMTSPYVTTQQQGDDMAATELDKVLGITEQVSITVVPNPVHEPGDMIRLKRGTPKWDLDPIYATDGSKIVTSSYTRGGSTTVIQDNRVQVGSVDNGSLYEVESVTIGLAAGDAMQINGKARVVR